MTDPAARKGWYLVRGPPGSLGADLPRWQVRDRRTV